MLQDDGNIAISRVENFHQEVFDLDIVIGARKTQAGCAFDRKRKDKSASNDEWKSETDPDAKIAKMKDGTTHLAYKAEHAVDLASELIVAAEIYHGDQADPQTLEDTVHQAQTNLHEAGSDTVIREVPADKGYHAAATLAAIREHTPYRTYIPEPQRDHDCRWTDKPPEHQAAVVANRRRTRGEHGKKLQRLRSERVERSFAHVCDSGGMRRSWLRGLVDVTKRYLIAAAAHNLGRILRRLFGVGKPKSLQGLRALAVMMQFTATTLRITTATVYDRLIILLNRFVGPNSPATTS